MFCGCGQQHFLNCFKCCSSHHRVNKHMLLQVLTPGSMHSSKLLRRGRGSIQAANQWAGGFQGSQQIKRSLNAQHMDALVSFVLSGAVHAAPAQLLECKAGLTSIAMALQAHGTRSVAPWMPLCLAAKPCPQGTKAVDLHEAFDMKMTCSFVFCEDHAFSRVGGSVYGKHDGEMLWRWISGLVAQNSHLLPWG